MISEHGVAGPRVEPDKTHRAGTFSFLSYSLPFFLFPKTCMHNVR